MQRENRFRRLLASYGQLTIMMIPIGVAINFVGGQIALVLKLPIYLDTIGTILVGALCGGLPGAFVGLISNVINSISSPAYLTYGLLSVMIGLLAGLLSRWGAFTRLWTSLLTAIPFALIGGFGGAVVTILLFGGLGPTGSAIVTGLIVTAGVDLNTANFIAAMPVDFTDKLPTVLIVFLVLRRIPNRLLTKLPLGENYLRKPVSTARLRPYEGAFDDDELALERR